MSGAEEFIESFHSLEGVTVAERRRNFSKLLSNHLSKKNDVEFLDKVFANLVPKTFLESLHRLDALIYFRRTSELFELLKEGDEIIVSKISKHEWFFEEAFGKVGCEELVNGIFPIVSYQARMKILTKLSHCLAGPRFDGIFDAIEKRYGLFIANKFITGCSSQKIKEFLGNEYVEISDRKLKLLYKRDPTLLEAFFRRQIECDQHRHVDNNSLMQFVCATDIDDFNQLRSKFDCVRVRLGRRNSRKMFQTLQKEQILAEPKSYKDFLHLSVLTRKLGPSYQTFVFNCLLPKDNGHLRMSIKDFVRKWLKYYPSKDHYKFFKDTVEQHYGVKLIDHPTIVNAALMERVPDKNELTELAKMKIETGKVQFLKYLSFAQSFPLLKEKINLAQTIPERRNFLELMVETCAFNKDSNALVEVLKYFCFRHRNETQDIYNHFLWTIESSFSYHVLNEEMWKYVQEIITLKKLKFDVDQSEEQERAYMDFLFRQGKPIDDMLLDFFKRNLDSFDCFPERQDPGFTKYCLEFVIKNLTIFMEDKLEVERKDFPLRIINALHVWNEGHKDFAVSFHDYPVLVESFNSALKERNMSQSVVERFINHKVFVDKDRGEYFKMFWETINYSKCKKHIGQFLKDEPLAIVQYFDHIIEYTIRIPESQHWYFIKKLTHTGLDGKCVSHCLANLKTAEYKIKDLVRCLSFLMPPEKYVELVNAQTPSAKKLDLSDKEAVEVYNYQCALATYLKNTRSYRYLPNLLKYCVGDYFHSALVSLSSLLYHTPEQEVHKITEQLGKSAVSVRKHAAFFTCELCDVASVARTIQTLSEKEKVESLKKRLFDTTIKYFVNKHPSEEFFRYVKMNMKVVNQNDDELLTNIVDLDQIPWEFRAPYGEFVWDFLAECVTERPTKLVELRGTLLKRMCCNEKLAAKLSYDFCIKLIQYDFDSPPVSDYKFTSCLQEMLLAHESRTSLLRAIIDKQDTYYIVHIFDQFNGLMRVTDSEFLTLLSTTVENLIAADIYRYFEEYVQLSYLKLRLDYLTNRDVSRVTARLVEFIESLVAKYEPFVLHLMADAVPDGVECLTYDTRPERNKYHYYDALLKSSTSVNVQMFVVLMMPTEEPSKSEDSGTVLKMHKDVLETLSQSTNTGVRLYYERKFIYQ